MHCRLARRRGRRPIRARGRDRTGRVVEGTRQLATLSEEYRLNAPMLPLTKHLILFVAALVFVQNAHADCDFHIRHAVASDLANNIDIGLEGSCPDGASTVLRSEVIFPVIGPAGQPVMNFWERVVRHKDVLPRLITIDYPFHSATADPMPRGSSVKVDLYQENSKVDSRILLIN